VVAALRVRGGHFAFFEADFRVPLAARGPEARPATTDEIAWAVAVLASARSAYTSGCIFTIDGGLAARST